MFWSALLNFHSFYQRILSLFFMPLTINRSFLRIDLMTARHFIWSLKLFLNFFDCLKPWHIFSWRLCWLHAILSHIFLNQLFHHLLMVRSFSLNFWHLISQGSGFLCSQNHLSWRLPLRKSLNSTTLFFIRPVILFVLLQHTLNLLLFLSKFLLLFEQSLVIF